MNSKCRTSTRTRTGGGSHGRGYGLQKRAQSAAVERNEASAAAGGRIFFNFFNRPRHYSTPLMLEAHFTVSIPEAQLNSKQLRQRGRRASVRVGGAARSKAA
jgi:hypothetical protein